MKKVYEAEPLKSLVVKRLVPTGEETEEELREYAKDMLATVHHPVGTCSMLPRELGGVVDTKLLVYGTENLRVVSVYASICFAHSYSLPLVIDGYFCDTIGKF